MASAPETIGRYRVTGKLGEGGMGVVYAAHDDRLQRPLAIKMLRPAAGDDAARERLWREARAAASVTHPGVCQLYEVGEADGELFLAMELLRGESLAARLERGALALADAMPIMLPVLSTLEALHQQGLIHRDLKPSNIFLTPHGVKLLDFGLARSLSAEGGTETRITQPGLVVGTPQYMAPEQLLGHPLDARTDVFACGALLYEMVAGRPPFAGGSAVEIFHAILYEQPPVLGGSAAIAAADRAIHRALAKRAEDRYGTAGAFAQDLRTALLLTDSGEAPHARTMTRLIVLPFRMLRPDAEIEFLSFGLADAITSSLSGLESLVVRSTLSAASFAGESLDLKRLAGEADVDVALTGTLLRAGERIRVSSQLLEVPGGRVLWSQTSQWALGDVFELQDDLAHRIVSSLSLPLTAREHRMLRHDVPASPKAYEYYLRASQIGSATENWELARDLYRQCLDEDPRYAPAWARLGRIYRVMAKYRPDHDAQENRSRAEAAFTRALELNPELPLAHNLYAHLEVDLGRAQEAMVRLVSRARARPADPDLFAGLVHACRYCGLLDASIAAFEHARRLDPRIVTSAAQTFFMRGDYRRVVEVDVEDIPFVRNLARVMLGETRQALDELRGVHPPVASRMMVYIQSLRQLLEGEREASATTIKELLAPSFRDPEAQYYVARHLSFTGQHEEAIALLGGIVDDGFYCFPAMARDPWLDPVRTRANFSQVLRRAEARHREAAAAFRAADGHRVLGLDGV